MANRSPDKPQFDRYSNNYKQLVNESISFVKTDAEWFTRYKISHLEKLCHRHFRDSSSLSFLDIGCGTGLADSLLAGKVGSLTGVDVSGEMVEQARSKNPWASYQPYDGITLPFDDASFDLLFTICVMHHVPPEQWETFLGEMKRVTKPGGLVVVYEHNPYNPLTRRAVNNCIFDEDAVLLKPGQLKKMFSQVGLESIRKEFILFFPFSNPVTRAIEKTLIRFPLGAQYCTYGKKK